MTTLGTDTVEQIQVLHVRMPLNIPYRVSGKTFDHFDMFLARVRVAAREGVGETVTAPGYSSDTEKVVSDLLQHWAVEMQGMDSRESLYRLQQTQKKHPFATATLTTAIETALAPFELTSEISLPLVGTVMANDGEDPESEVENLLQQGYQTLKVKVGWNPQADAFRVNRINKAVDGRASIRLDANRGYNLSGARYFVDNVDPEGIEHFEQPFGHNDWQEMARLSEDCPLPLMLDESIDSEESLESAIRLGCAQAVKFKLMKAGGFGRLTQLIQRAQEAGLKVVLGNGVAGDIGDFHEIMVAARHLDTAGEMNGFLKQRERLLENPYTVAHGKAIVPKGYVPRVDWQKIAPYIVRIWP